MRIALVGANGQLGSDLVRVLQPVHNLTPLPHADVEVTDPESVGAMIQRY